MLPMPEHIDAKAKRYKRRNKMAGEKMLLEIEMELCSLTVVTNDFTRSFATITLALS